MTTERSGMSLEMLRDELAMYSEEVSQPTLDRVYAWVAVIDAELAARHAAVPDEIDHSDAPSGAELSSYADRAYAQGWNACRKAMLAQRDGG